ncbi:beta-galactosidase trimerization domain-containing protein [bacterium]|nr:beta-galactosidase trimerization domain-containing protein [bacterium]
MPQAFPSFRKRMYNRFFFLYLAIILTKWVIALPIEETAYGKSHFRLEFRPLPSSVENSFLDMEKSFAKSGVTARWISVVDPWGSPVYPSQIIPSPYQDSQHNADILQKWVDSIHSQGIPVVSWYPLIFSESGWQTHPEWRQVSLLPWPEGKSKEISCCINSGYGDALIKLMCEAIDKFKLDGIWFDGSAFTEIWERPLPLTCFCDACRQRFKRETGLDIPEKFDWNDTSFRKWVAWRYKVFAEFIGKIAGEIRRRYPNVAVVVNHYHRPQIPWHSAIPLDLYEADIITGSEATGIDSVDLVMRLCRAYNRSQSEVWRPLDIGDNPQEAPQTNDLLHHALACYIAGGFPSYGYPGGDINKAYETISLISPIMRQIHPYVGGKSLPYLALYVSQQSETFYFGRAIDGRGWKLEPFFSLLNRWTRELMTLQVPPDYIYDKALTEENLSRYKVLLLPFSPAISDKQAETILNFVKEGGIAYLGPGCGERDEWGEPRTKNPLGDKAGFNFDSIYPPSASELKNITIISPEGRPLSLLTSLYASLNLKGRNWKILYRFKDTQKPALAIRKYGKGYLIISAFDLAVNYPWYPVEGIDTKISPSTDDPAEGNRCAEFLDGPNAPYSFCPDMEVSNFPSISQPNYLGGKLSFFLKLVDAEAQFELRNSQTGETGILLHFSDDGHLLCNGKELMQLPLNQWVRLEVSFLFPAESQKGKFNLKILLPGGEYKKWEDMPLSESWNNFDWVVIFGPGRKVGHFFVDDIEISGLKGMGEEKLVFKEDFEEYEKGKNAFSFTSFILNEIEKLAPPPIEIKNGENLRFGAFQKDGLVLVHLHNPAGTWRDFSKEENKSLTLVIRFPVSEATLPLKENRELKLTKRGNVYYINLPFPSLYEIISLKR